MASTWDDKVRGRRGRVSVVGGQRGRRDRGLGLGFFYSEGSDGVPWGCGGEVKRRGGWFCRRGGKGAGGQEHGLEVRDTL